MPRIVRPSKTKKADVVRRPKAFDHVGLLSNKPPAGPGCSSSSHPTAADYTTRNVECNTRGDPGRTRSAVCRNQHHRGRCAATSFALGASRYNAARVPLSRAEMRTVRRWNSTCGGRDVRHDPMVDTGFFVGSAGSESMVAMLASGNALVDRSSATPLLIAVSIAPWLLTGTDL